MGEQERSGGLDCASGVLIDDGWLMPVGVDVPLHLADGSCLSPAQRPGIGGSVVRWTIPIHPTEQDMSAPQHTGDLILP